MRLLLAASFVWISIGFLFSTLTGRFIQAGRGK